MGTAFILWVAERPTGTLVATVFDGRLECLHRFQRADLLVPVAHCLRGKTNVPALASHSDYGLAELAPEYATSTWGIYCGSHGDVRLRFSRMHNGT